MEDDPQIMLAVALVIEIRKPDRAGSLLEKYADTVVGTDLRIDGDQTPAEDSVVGPLA